MAMFRFIRFLLLSLAALLMLATQQPAEAGPYRCGDGTIVNCASQCADRGGLASDADVVCGNGYIELGELCDRGALNSDVEVDGCRMNCRRAYCGDGVVDSGEQCDDGQSSNNNSPNHCRPNCTLPVCGDGIHDDGTHSLAEFLEQCDDGNTDNSDGCVTDCTTCTRLTDNIEVTSDTKLCRDVFDVADYGDEGAIIVKYPGITIDCDGATLRGTGVGAGIFVKMCNDVWIKNCTISGYAVGVKAVDSQGLNIQMLGNNFKNNTEQIVLENSTKVSVAPQVVQQVVKIDAAGAWTKAAVEAEAQKQRNAAASTMKEPAKFSAAVKPEPNNHRIAPTPVAKAPAVGTSTVKTRMTLNRLKAATPLTVAPSAPVIQNTMKVVPSGKVVKIDKMTYLELNVPVKAVEVWVGNRRLGRLADGQRFDFTKYVGRALNGELTVVYFDVAGTRTVQEIKVGLRR
ncbi:MAG: hypothetical protein K8R59_16150 [Thermoanaerobaculales bacterium]|nr:hypothetical protein [Thermoanaerobaculales bacterium]